jgi:hypothetical protein
MSNEQLLELLKKNPISVACGVLVLLLGVAIYLRLDLVPESAKLLEEKVSEGERLIANVNNSAQLLEQLAAMTEARTEVEKRFAKRNELAMNLQYFYRLETETGVKLLTLVQNPAPPIKPGTKVSLGGIGFTLSFQGSYLTAMDFLRRVENGFHYSRTTSAGIATVAGNRAGPVTISLSLELFGQL